MGHETKNYSEPGAERLVVGGSLDVVSGGDLDIESGGALKIAGTAVTSSAAELNIVDGVTAGTVTASKAVVVGANKNLDVLAVQDLKLGAGAGTSVSATAAELNLLDNIWASATFTVGAESGGNVINVGIQLKDAAGADMAIANHVLGYLSDNDDGSSIASAAPDGGVAVGTDGLAIPLVAGKAWLLVSEADGDIDLNLTHAAGAKTCYLVLCLPNGRLTISGAITFA